MRALFLFLLLANVAFFAWARYLSPQDAVADPAPLGRQISPEKLRVLPGEPPTAALKPVPPAPPPPPAPVAAALTAVSPASCLEWGSFTLADAPRAEKALEPLALGPRLAQRRTEETAGFWVFIPPQAMPNPRQGALRKAQELRALNVDDYFIVSEEGPNRWAISLGVFRNEDAAQARLAALRQQGVRTAQVGARETVVPKVWLQVKGVDAPIEARLKDVARQVEGSELRACAG